MGKPVKLGAGTAVLCPYKRKAQGCGDFARALKGAVSGGYIVRINGKMRPAAWARLSDAPTTARKAIWIARQTGGE
jgi:hypothetical protein